MGSFIMRKISNGVGYVFKTVRRNPAAKISRLAEKDNSFTLTYLAKLRALPAKSTAVKQRTDLCEKRRSGNGMTLEYVLPAVFKSKVHVKL